MKFCTYCGKELLDEAVICPGCGCKAGTNTQTNSPGINYYNELSNRVKINGIIWICVATLQLILAMTVNWILLIVGVLNVITGIKDLSYSKELLNQPAGVTQRFEPLVGPIIILIYNAIFGGIIGVVGSIYYLVGIRNYVLSNRQQFVDEEEKVNIT